MTFYQCQEKNCLKKFSDVSFDPWSRRTTDFYVKCVKCGTYNVKKIKNVFGFKKG